MKQTTALIFVIILCLLIGAGPTHATGTAEAKGPRAVFQEKSVEFDPVVAGTEVTHQFVMRNEGSAILKIKNLGST